MSGLEFGKRLAQELPRCHNESWASAKGQEAILTEVAARHPIVAWTSSLAMSKLMPLVVMVFFLAASHVPHGLSQTRGALPKLAQAMAFLSVLLFRAAIVLIGSVYHIDLHSPDGIALWAGGGLLTAWPAGSQPPMVTSMALAALWTWTEPFDHWRINWPPLGYLAFSLVPLFRHGKIAARGWALC